MRCRLDTRSRPNENHQIIEAVTGAGAAIADELTVALHDGNVLRRSDSYLRECRVPEDEGEQRREKKSFDSSHRLAPGIELLDRNMTAHVRLRELVVAGVGHEHSHFEKDIVSSRRIGRDLEADFVNSNERRGCA